MHRHQRNMPLTLSALAVVDDRKTKLVNALDSTERFKSDSTWDMSRMRTRLLLKSDARALLHIQVSSVESAAF